MADEVKLFSFWINPHESQIAFAEKGVKYVHSEEDLEEQEYPASSVNPVYKNIPVLIRNGKQVCESLIIVQHIDEMWKDKAPLLPSDLYERTHSIICADFPNVPVFAIGREANKVADWLARASRDHTILMTNS
uniref:GST N-terminal domain-containing protein n=1 Tax=Salix viminalis TaxID=40686 RepID=A0A6N2K9T0_SALVM